MTNMISEATRVPRSASAIDITGPENLMLLLANPGDEVSFGPFIAELCARGRPPFVAILGDGAHDGSHGLANLCERRSRRALAGLGVPEDRVLFVGLRMGSVPAERDGLFEALLGAMTLLNWRKDCNVVGAGGPDRDDGDRIAAWQIARAVAGRNGLRLVVRIENVTDVITADERDFDGRAWLEVVARACSEHRVPSGGAGGIETVSRFRSFEPNERLDVSLE